MSQVIHILRITPHLFRPGGWPVAYDPVGGLQTQVWRLTEELDKAGISQTILTSHIPGYPRQSSLSCSARVECVGVALPELLCSIFLGVTWFSAVVRHLLINRATYDLVHIHYNHWIWPRILTIIADKLNIPIVVSLSTELWVSSRYRWLVCSKKINLARWIERKAIKSSDCVIALTARDATRWTTELELKPEQIVVIPDAIDTRTFRLPCDEETLNNFRKQYKIPENKKIVTYIGRIRSEKGWEDLPRLATTLYQSGVFVLICGDGPDRRKLENAMRETGGHDTWSITGFLDPDEVRMVLYTADVLILPSRREAFGSVLLEAMASGVPAVAYAVGGIIEVAGTSQAIRLVSPNDGSAFAQAIIELLNNTPQRRHLIEKGYQRVQDFSLAQSGVKTMSCYQRVLRVGSSFDARRGAGTKPEP